jgi:Flp pilus assembly protein TadG
MTRRFVSLIRDERGASIIEMALVAPFLATLVIGMVDISQAYSAKLKLTQAAQRAVEHAMQGEKTSSLYDTLQAEGAAAAGVATSAVTVKYWLECNGVNQNTSPATMTADFEKVCTSGQTFARYVTVDIQKTYVPLFSMRWAGSNAGGTFTLHGTAGVRVQ